ncbi:hypothetical protein [Flavobacterium johnsoniae]|uniref:hypothetical protein n=1 Tax=Flavobacterium johnsoniae TaxID=986 RepID=UPI003D95C409
MKKITILLLLLNSGLIAAQTKTVLGPHGERITINPNGINDNLGNHTAAQTLNLDGNDISNVSDIFIKKEAQFFDQSNMNNNYFSLNKTNGTFGIYNSLAGKNALSIDEINSKTTVISSQIPKGTDGSLPQKDYMAVSVDENGNVIWKPIYKIKGATTFQFLVGSSINSAYNSPAFNDLPGFNNYQYTAQATGTLVLKAVLISVVPNTAVKVTPTTVKTEMVININNTPAAFGSSLITAASNDSYVNGGGDFAASTVIYCHYHVTEGTTYKISIQARTADQTGTIPYYPSVGSYVGSYKHVGETNLDTFNVSSSLMGTLITD